MSVEAMLRAHDRLHAARDWLRSSWDTNRGCYVVEIRVTGAAEVEDGWHRVGRTWASQGEAVAYALYLADWLDNRTDLTLPRTARIRATWAAAPDLTADAIAAAGERGFR